MDLKKEAIVLIKLLMVAIGGAAGAAGRYLLSLIPAKTAFPVMTLATNLLGALLIGFIVGCSETRGVQERWMLFWKTGVCGGFTTFSTFSLEALNLFQKGSCVLGAIYILLSVLLCLFGVILGRQSALWIFD